MLRESRLYPRLVKIAGGMLKADKIIAAIPSDELTIWGALYKACGWHVYEIFEYPHTNALMEHLLRDKPNGITLDGYFAHYSVTLDQCWEAVKMDIAAYNMRLWRDDNNIYLGYAHIPDIYISQPNGYKRESFATFKFKFDLTKLQRKLVAAYGTPYQEEIIALRLIAQLPQPIAEAIADCIHGVMERRFIPDCSPQLLYTDDLAAQLEIRYTYYPELVYTDIQNKMSDKRAWEFAKKLIIRDDFSEGEDYDEGAE